MITPAKFHNVHLILILCRIFRDKFDGKDNFVALHIKKGGLFPQFLDLELSLGFGLANRMY